MGTSVQASATVQRSQYSLVIRAMKTIVSILLFATLAQAMPRFLVICPNYPFCGAVSPADFPTPGHGVIPMDQVEFMPQQYHHRVARSAWPQAPTAPGPGAFIIPDNIRAAEEQIAAGSGPTPQVTGHDAVDYGAYTGGYGAFGWYSDHPNHDGIGHRR